jgi:peptidoglycan hydrolase CwlO-like protein
LGIEYDCIEENVPMWNEEQQRQLDDLRVCADQGTLSAEGQRQLDQLLSELERAEWTALQPGLETLRQEQQQLQSELGQLRSQNAVLGALTERYADLLARAKAQLAGLMSEREALRAEYERAQR